MIDPQLLDQAITNVARTALIKDFRDWFMFNAPKEFVDVYVEYTNLLNEQMGEDIDIGEDDE